MLRDAAPNLMGIDAKKAALSRMSPEQMRQHALANSDDLITMSLISQIQSERNKADLARKAQQANASPPKVTQQLAESIPVEESGLAALPAQNMEMAEGGIVGYAEGGVMYPGLGAQEGSGLLPSTTGYEGMGIMEFIQKFGMDAYNKLKNAIPGESTEERRARQKREVYEASPSGQQEKAMAEVNKPTPIDSMDLPPRAPDPRFTGAVAQDQPAGARPGGAPQGIQQVLPRGAPQGRPSPQAAPRAPMAPQQGIEDLYKQAQKMAGAGTQADPDAAVRSEILANRQAQAERVRADAEQRAQGLESILKPREERIAQREAALQKQGEMDKSMAIINAGLAMMQSTGAGLSGIAEGAAKGMKQYGEAMALSKAEQQKISDARDAYDELKFNAQNMSQKDITSAKNLIDEAANISKESGIAAAQKRYDTNQKTAETIFGKAVDATTAAQNRASQEKIAGMQAAAGGARAAANEPRQQLAELKALQTNLQAQLKATMPYGASRAAYEALQAQLAQVNKAVAQMAGLDTMGAGPGATAPAQTRPPLGSFQK